VDLVTDVAVAVAGSGTAVIALSAGLVVRRLGRSNRVVAHRRSPAPLTWRWSPRRAPILHRRLRHACAVLTAVVGTPRPAGRLLRRRQPAPSSSLQQAGHQLLERAVTLDARLVDADRRGPLWRQRELPALAREVHAIELGASRVASLAEEVRSYGAGEGSFGSLPGSAEHLLDALEAALAELRHTGTGLSSPG